jgi:hypothetical protein
MSDLNVELSVNDLAHFLFIRNVDNKPITINITGDGLENTRDIFSFCLDIMLKGLVILFGTDNKVVINDLTMDQFNTIKQKMRCANIECHLEVIPLEEPNEDVPDLWTQNFLNINKAYNADENMKLTDYHFDLQLSNFIYKIWFELKYNLPQNII